MESLLNTKEISLEQLKELAGRDELFAIIDACDAPQVPLKMQECGEARAISLFRGTAQDDYWAVGPYLVTVDDLLLHWLHETLWKNPWGVFVLARSPLIEMQNHFRKLLIAELPDGKNWFFRYYDPRVLPAFLFTCNAAELQMFYGSVTAYGLSTEKSGAECSLIYLQ